MPFHIPLIKFKRCLAFVFHHHHSALFQFNTHKLCSTYCKSTINYIFDDVIIVINHSPSGRNVKVRKQNVAFTLSEMSEETTCTKHSFLSVSFSFSLSLDVQSVSINRNAIGNGFLIASASAHKYHLLIHKCRLKET